MREKTWGDDESHIELLRQRGELLRAVRQFFYEREFVEVETPLVAAEVIPELHIEPVGVGEFFSGAPAMRSIAASAAHETGASRDATHRRGGYLQASPELHMKRLVAAGMRAVFQITRSFRGGERGTLHAPEFTIVEWYRTGDDLQAGMDLLDALCQSVLAAPPAQRTTYAAAFEKYVGVDPHSATIDALSGRAAALRVDASGMSERDGRDEWLNQLLALRVEPELGRDAPEILFDYPASQAALAKTATRDNARGHRVEVAERFELYYRGVELANGYHELTDAAELRRRLLAVNGEREASERAALPMPESLLAAMEAGLPSCAGCALGFDRLAMLALGKTSIADVRAFADE